MPDLERILKSTPGSLSRQWYEDGAAVDAGTVTVGITRADGTTLVTTGTATTGSGTAARVYNLTTTHTALLDTLTVTWTSTLKGTTTSVVEVVGGFVFTIADARNTPGLNAQNNDSSYRISTARIVDARTEVERALEDELGFAMVPRYALETIRGDGGSTLMLSWPHIQSIRSVSVNGTAFGVSDLALISVGVTGSMYYPSGWTLGAYDNVTVGYEYGLSVPPARARDIALALAKRALTGAPADDRATSMSTDEQTTSFYLPGAGEPFDVPAANRFVAGKTLRVGLA